MSYKKVGGIHFLRIMRFGFNFYWTRKPVTIASLCKASEYETRRYARSQSDACTANQPNPRDTP